MTHEPIVQRVWPQRAYYMDICTFCDWPATSGYIRDTREDDSMRAAGATSAIPTYFLTPPLPVCPTHYRASRRYDAKGRLISAE